MNFIDISFYFHRKKLRKHHFYRCFIKHVSKAVFVSLNLGQLQQITIISYFKLYSVNYIK